MKKKFTLSVDLQRRLLARASRQELDPAAVLEVALRHGLDYLDYEDLVRLERARRIAAEVSRQDQARAE